MRILTLTTYEGYNYGASLQAYALQKYLLNYGHEAAIIRFEPEYLMRYYAFWYVNPESKLNKNAVTRMLYRLLKWGQRQTTLKRKKVFDYFNHHVLIETDKKWCSSEELMKNPPAADLYICGSDQIWNVLYDAGKDPVFYLDFVKRGKKASYAASFSFLDLPKEHFLRIKSSLKSFDAVSVREWQGKELLDKMEIEGTWVLDPTLLLSTEEWNQLIDRKDILSVEKLESASHPYLLIYDFEGNEDLRSFAEEYARIHGLKIYAITDRFPLRYAEKNFKNAGPVDFIRLIKGCSCFISNSFHGTVFSILYHKPMFVFNRHRHQVNSRMESLLKVFQLQDCLIDSEDKRAAAFQKTFDWNKVEQLKEEQLQISKKYLEGLGV